MSSLSYATGKNRRRAGVSVKYLEFSAAARHNIVYLFRCRMGIPLFQKIFFGVCLAAGAGMAVMPAPAPDNALRLREFNRQIDSLEVAKQEKKRSGQSIDELEGLTGSLRDSVADLRRGFEQGTAATRAAQSPECPARTSAWPLSLGVFDRITIAAAGVFLLIAAVFFFVYFSAAARRRRNRSPAAPAAKRGDPLRNGASRSDTAAQRAYAAQIKPGPPPAQPRPETPASPLPSKPSGQRSDLPRDLSELVARAAAEGLDAKEISRRYHISEDEVALIRAMGRKKT